jgi:hypothetical protein
MEDFEKVLKSEIPRELKLKIWITNILPDENRKYPLFFEAFNILNSIQLTARKCFKTMYYIIEGTFKYRDGCAIDSSHETRFQERIKSIPLFHRYLWAISQYAFSEGNNIEFKSDIDDALDKLQRISKEWLSFNRSHLSFQLGGLYCLKSSEYKKGVDELREVLEEIITPLSFILNRKYKEIIKERGEEKAENVKEKGYSSNSMNADAIVKCINTINKRRQLINRITKKLELIYSVISALDISGSPNGEEENSDEGNDENIEE